MSGISSGYRRLYSKALCTMIIPCTGLKVGHMAVVHLVVKHHALRQLEVTNFFLHEGTTE
jgi:hypothetical protein